jgi:hypothetical protein
MMADSGRSAFRFALAAALSASATAAIATPQYLIVGDGSQNQHCQYATIQDAIDAAAANGPDLDYVMITSTVGHTGQELRVLNQNVLIEGGYLDCELNPGSMPTAIIGDGVHSVLTLASSDGSFHEMRVRNLDISLGGGGASSVGGGVATGGYEAVMLENVRIHDNASGNGGGLAIVPIGTSAPIVELDAGTRIDHNTTNGVGGGIYAGGGALHVRADRVSIDANAATAGGGIACIDCDMGVGAFGSIGNGEVATGALIADNTAVTAGGGLLLGGANAFLGAYELGFHTNHAGTAGGGIYAYNGAYLSIQRDYPGAFSFNCAPTDPCTRLRGNSVGDGMPPSTGGAIYLAHGARADLAQVLIADNTAADGSAVTVDGATFNAESTLFTRNHSADPANFSGPLIRAKYTLPDGPPHMRIAFATFAGNTERLDNGMLRGAIDILAQADTLLSIYSSAMYDAVYPLVAYSAFTTDCVVHATGGLLDGHGMHTRETITGGPGEPSGPGFNQPLNGDYRLRSESFLADYCDTAQYVPSTRDLVLTPRCVDDPRNPDDYGSCDVGAYESDQIFANGFE